MTATRDQLVEAGARALDPKVWKGRPGGEPYPHDEARRRESLRKAAAVLAAVLPLITPPDALHGPQGCETRAPGISRPPNRNEAL